MTVRVAPGGIQTRQTIVFPAARERALHRREARLTHRQREVAILISRGLTNREIAVALFISTYTAASHVSAILARLDLVSRSHVAAWVTERELDEQSQWL